MRKLPSQKYWEDRAERNIVLGEKSGLDYEKTLRAAYQATTQSIEKELAAFYGKYAKDNKITLAEAQQRLKPKELTTFNQTAKRYLDEIDRLGDKGFTREYRGYLAELSGRAYVTKLDELNMNIRHRVERLAVENKQGIENRLQKGFRDSYMETMYDIQSKTGVGVLFIEPGNRQLAAAANENWDGNNYADSVWRDKNKLVNELRREIPREFVRGGGASAISQKVADRLGVSYSNAQRLIRTEMNHISNKATIAAYNDVGIVKKYQYLATLDNRTSDICAGLDGKIFNLSDAMEGVNLPPMHPYCRSTTIPHFMDDEIGDYLDAREARDPSGKTYLITHNMNYKDWETFNRMAGYAKQVYEDNVKKEPHITKLLKEVAANIGGELEGLTFRLKGAESYVRKINSLMAKNGWTEKQAIDSLNDVVRFTIKNPEERYTQGVKDAFAEVSKSGYVVGRVRNTFWRDDKSYRGINTVLEDTKGNRIELQFHTAESLRVKEINHVLYDEERLVTTSQARKAELNKIMLDNARTIPIPPNVKDIESTKEEG